MVTRQPPALAPPSAAGRSRRAPVLAALLLLLLTIVVLSGAWWLARQVRGTAPVALGVPVSPVVLDRNDRLMRAFNVADGRWRLPVRSDQVDPLFLAMLLASEERRFFSHAGVDPRALLRAAAPTDPERGLAAAHGRAGGGACRGRRRRPLGGAVGGGSSRRRGAGRGGLRRAASP